MLQIFRDKAQSTFIQAIVLVIALVFIFWGVGTNMMNNHESAVVVNDEEISFQDYQNLYDKMLSNYRQQFGGSVPEELLKSLGIKQQVKSQLIQAALLRQGATDMGIMASAAEVQRRIQEMVQFQENGHFSMEKYKSLLKANRLTPHKFEANMRYDMLSGKGIAAIESFSTIVTNTEILDRFQQEKEAVSVLFAKTNPSQFIDKVAVTDEALTAWFEKNSSRYKTEPKIKLKFLSFPYKDEAKNITIAEEQIKKRYQKNMRQYQTPERRHARHILFKVDENSSSETHSSQLAKAEDVLTKARAGEDFGDLAKTYSEGPSKDSGGDLGFFSRGQMVKPFNDAVFSLKEGEISDVVKTQFGYHIILVEEIQPAMIRPLAEVRTALETQLKSEAARPLAFKKANEAYEGIIAAGSLDAYETDTPVASVQESEFFDRTAVPEAMDNADDVLNTAFSLKKGELSSLLESPNGYTILYAEEIKEPVVPEIADVLDEVSQDYKEEQAKTMAREQAEKLLEDLRSGTSFADAAENMKIKTTEADIHRKSTGAEAKGFPSVLYQNLFTLSEKNPFPENIAVSGQDFIVYQFNGRNVPTADELTDSDKELYTKEILSNKQDRVLMAWIRHQEKNADIFTNKNL